MRLDGEDLSLQCRWLMESIYRDPVAILRAEFCTLWSLRTPEGGT